MKQADFLDRVSKVKSQQEALDTIGLLYPSCVDSSESFYHASAIEDMDWQSFYAVRKMEDEFDAGLFASGYIATVLAFPKISLYYGEIAPSVHQEKSDFCARILDMTVTKLIPEWDKEKNDNFFAYMLPHLLTVRNAILAEDGGPSKYLKQKKGLSLVSMEGMKEKSESGTTWDMPDYEKNTEEEALFRMRGGKMALLKKVVGLSSDDSLPTTDNIWNTILCRKLFHGSDEEELSMLDDPAISSALSEYFEKREQSSTPQGEEEEVEAEACLA